MELQVSAEKKLQIIKALLYQRENFAGSDIQYANSLDIHKSVYVQLKKGIIERVLKDAKWINLAKLLNVPLGDKGKWQTAKTPVFIYITEQLELCQAKSLCGIFCDRADIGKSHAGKLYTRTHKNAIYIDCSQVKSRLKLVKQIAKEFGLDCTGKYYEIYANLTYYLSTVVNPLIILDEAGDLDYPAFLELKALWNAVEGYCGWYMMGADGLKTKIENGIGSKKVGFTEIFRRYGSRYQSLTPFGEKESRDFQIKSGAMVLKANVPEGVDIRPILHKTNGSLTSIYNELTK